ncbi:MAG: hypothetical protein DRR42_03470 [Gammaproteobacteria bacterium]|nr:MAG: hypothetical protein DRR42_03470 [Gammaproteobacteria bacterium]
MSERKAVYIVGNIVHVNFGQFNIQLDGGSHESSVYGMSHANENTSPISLKVGVSALYVKTRDEQRFSDVDCLVTWILGFIKLLEDEEKADGEGYESVVSALRLATVEVLLAVHERNNRPKTSESGANEALIRYQQLIESSGGELFTTIEDGKQLVFIPTSIHIRMGTVYKMQDIPDKAQQCFENSEKEFGQIIYQRAGRTENNVQKDDIRIQGAEYCQMPLPNEYCPVQTITIFLLDNCIAWLCCHGA